ncbi:MAG: mono/diheme cytochrome c family protein [Paracoccaceae bacterium]|jgi:mono/diheme cytochrome c family protein
MRVIIAGLVAVCGMQGMANAQDAEGGALLYYQHCASCHGLKADGAGPMAPVLLVQPTNLRALAYGEGDTFPTKRVVRRIDGGDPLVSHGSPMPVYGPFFEDDDVVLKVETGELIMTSRAVVDLLAYLRTLQE